MAARAIRAIHPPSRVIIVTSYDQPFLRQSARELGAIAYVLKDNLAELRSLLSREAISSSASSPASGQALETAPTSDPADPGSPGSSCTVPTDPLIEAGLKPEKPTSSSVDHLLRVLMVEDNKNDCELILRQLMRCGFEPRVRRVDNGAELQRALEQDFWDIIITDHNLPTFSGAEAIA